MSRETRYEARGSLVTEMQFEEQGEGGFGFFVLPVPRFLFFR